MTQTIAINRKLFLIDGVVLTPKQIKQFWAMVGKSRTEGDCWTWRGDRSEDGHGIFRAEYEAGTASPLWAHRVAYSLSSLIQVPEGQCVRHTCGLACCCNPAHLITGTHKDNYRDHLEHKAQAAKLTDEERQIIAASKARVPHLARRFGVTNGIVWAIKFGKPGARKGRWKQSAFSQTANM